MSLAGSSRPLHAARLQGPMSTLSPAMGATCGRREREAGAGNGRSNPFHVPTFATVEGTLVHETPSTFAGRRKNMSLGRSEASVAGLVPMQAFSPTTTGALWKKEEGNVVSVREAHALDAPMLKKSIDTFRGHVLHSVQRPVHVNRHSTLEWVTIRRCRGSRGIAVGKTCASRRNRHRGHDFPDEARLAACHRFAGNREGRA
jgi:hypothetical protein